MRRLEKRFMVKVSEEFFLEALTNKGVVSQWSGAEAEMSKEVGASFSLWGGSIVGVNSLVTPNRLQQKWKEKSWDSYSNVSFEWRSVPDGLEVTLVHTDIPEGSFLNVERGWSEHYLNPLISWLESNNL